MSTNHTAVGRNVPSASSYIVGFGLSVLLTLEAYFFVTMNLLTGQALVIVLLVLAVTQLIVQLFFFLHLGQERGPRWNLIFFAGTVGVVLLVVVGSIWIMNNLNYTMMPHEVEEYMMEEEGIHHH